MTQRLTVVICLLASAAAGQGPPPPQGASLKDGRADFRAVCTNSAMTVCWVQAISGDRAAVRTCMIKNLAKLSPECQAVVRAHMGDRPSTPH